MFKNRPYSLRKSRNIFNTCYSWYSKHGNTLSDGQRTRLESHLEMLEKALLDKNREESNTHARNCETFYSNHSKRTTWVFFTELGIALLVALAVAVVIRSMWFEFYEIPTGSMRPSFKEKDRLTVSKTAFGLNIPLQTDHFYFDPHLVERGKVVIFSADHLPRIDPNAIYLGVLPYTKRYIKRMIGKPGDSLYFYGGQIYGVDKFGNATEELINDPWMKNIEHIPFLNFGDASSPSGGEITFNLMNREIGKLTVTGVNKFKSEVFDGQNWVVDNPEAVLQEHNSIQTYSDVWGIRNFAMARLLTEKELSSYSGASRSKVDKGVLYLELRHTPNLTNPSPQFVGVGRKQEMQLSPFVTVVPLQDEDLNTIMDNMYTARFVVEDERARSYGSHNFHPGSPIFYQVPDGTYEFYHGKAYKIDFGGTTFELPADHPLNKRTPDNVHKLFNIGIELSDAMQPYSKEQAFFPHRYSYFRKGDLYLLGAPILLANSPTLVAFNEREKALEASDKGYVAFRDYGPPLKNGKFDVEFIKAFGVKVPDHHYLVLGDNHAMSADSRVFGFVPEQNIQGIPSFLFWPFGSRWGFPPNTPYPFLTLPRLIVWSLAGTVFLIWFILKRRNHKKATFKRIKH